MEPVCGVHLTDSTPRMKLLRSHFFAVYEKVVCTMDAEAVGESADGAVFGDEGERGEWRLYIARVCGENGVRQSKVPGCAAADGRAIEREDKYFAMINDCSNQFET